MQQKSMPASRRSGNSIIEVTFMMPWLLFLFVGVFDFGFYAYALIATQNAARAVAVHNSISKTAATDPDCIGMSDRDQRAEFGAERQGHKRVWGDHLGFPDTTVAFARCCRSIDLPPPSAPILPRALPGALRAQAIVTYSAAVLIPMPGLNYCGALKITRPALMTVNPSADF